jgi:hypothetical protein
MKVAIMRDGQIELVDATALPSGRSVLIDGVRHVQAPATYTIDGVHYGLYKPAPAKIKKVGVCPRCSGTGQFGCLGACYRCGGSGRR